MERERFVVGADALLSYELAEVENDVVKLIVRDADFLIVRDIAPLAE